MKAIDWTGKRKGLLTALYKNPDKPSHWFVKCDCGTVKSISFSGTSAKSCGCLHTPMDDIYHEQLKLRIKENSFINSSGCWNWLLQLDKAGYGCATYRQKPMRSHQLSWTVFKGKIPNKMFVCHSCDNRQCCNPDHLFLGTHRHNTDDMVSKGRQAKGEKKPNTTLTDENVLEIRRLYTVGLTQVEIGKLFSIRQSKVSLIVRRQAWKHI